MWKYQMIIAITCNLLQRGLFTTDILITGNFNKVIFPQAVLWTAWTIVCVNKFMKEKAKNKNHAPAQQER